jgi:hypothetical protein
MGNQLNDQTRGKKARPPENQQQSSSTVATLSRDTQTSARHLYLPFSPLIREELLFYMQYNKVHT